MNAAELIKRGALFYPNHTGVIFQGETLTIGQVYRNSIRMANSLLSLGLKKGDRVAFLLANSLQSVEIDFALLLTGIVRVPLNTRQNVKRSALGRERSKDLETIHRDLIEEKNS